MLKFYYLCRRAEAERQLDGEEDLFDTPEADDSEKMPIAPSIEAPLIE